MGRYKKYVTKKDRQQAKQRWNHEYYIRNKQQVDAAAKRRYHKKLSKMRETSELQ